MPQKHRSNNNIDKYGLAAINDEIETLLATTTRGSRHTDIYRSSCRMGQIIRDGRLPHNYARARLIDVAHQIGLPTASAIRQITRGLQWGQQNPRTTNKNPHANKTKTTANQNRQDTTQIWKHATQNPNLNPTQLRMLNAALKTIQHHGKRIYTYSDRQWAEHANLSPSTINKYRHTLAPYIIIQKNGNRWTHTPTTYKLGTPPPTQYENKRAGRRPSHSEGTEYDRSFAHLGETTDPAAHGPRQSNAWAILQYLNSQDCSQSVKTIASVLELSEATVRAQLKSLLADERVRLVETAGCTGRATFWESTGYMSEDTAEWVERMKRDRRDRHRKQRVLWRLTVKYRTIAAFEKAKQDWVVPALRVVCPWNQVRTEVVLRC